MQSSAAPGLRLEATLSIAVPPAASAALAAALPPSVESSSGSGLFWATSPSATCVGLSIVMVIDPGAAFGAGHALYDVAFTWLPAFPSLAGQPASTVKQILVGACTDVPEMELATLGVTARTHPGPRTLDSPHARA